MFPPHSTFDHISILSLGKQRYRAGFEPVLSGSGSCLQTSCCTRHWTLLPLTCLEASPYLGTPNTWTSSQPPGATRE